MGPPSLETLIAKLDEAEEYQEFLRIIREFLPEREAEILHEPTPDQQIRAFASRFEDRYFPLDTGVEESYRDMIRGIPVVVMGLSYDDFHEGVSNWRPGFLLMTYLCQSGYDDEGTKVAQAEACLEHVPADLIRQAPDGGLSPEEVHELFDDTPHKALANWADILYARTGNFFLDTDYETLWEGGFPDWDRETVEEFTRQWQQAEATYDEIGNLAGWLEEDPPARFAELIKIIRKR
jgi:hypothetical protein